MHINKKEFISFLDLITLRRELENTECLLDVSSDKISAFILNPSRIFALYGNIGGTFEPIGKIGIDNLKTFKGLINNFKEGEIDIIKSANKLVLENSHQHLKISYILRSPDYIKNYIEPEKFNEKLKEAQGNSFSVSNEIIRQILQYYSSIQSDKLNISCNGNVLSLSLEERENEIIADFPISERIKPFNIKISKLLIDILSTINSNVSVSVNSENAISITYNQDNINVVYLLALMKK